MSANLKVQLVGSLSVTDGSGVDCTPRGAKARGLVALLAMTKDGRRSRRWIESKLWSDRAPEQASGSLRQTLMELRTALGASSGLLIADREFITLAGVTTDIDEDGTSLRTAVASGRDLLEGLDIRDQAFEAWLTEQRARLTSAAPTLTTPMTAPPSISFVLTPGRLDQGLGAFISLALADAIAGLVSEFATVEVLGNGTAEVQLGPNDRGIALQIESLLVDDRLHLLVALRATRTQQMLWSRRVSMPMDQADVLSAGEFPGIVFEASEAALLAIPKILATDVSALRAEAIVARGVKEMFSFEVGRLRMADALFTQATQLMPNARTYAWHSLLRQIMAVERTEPGNSNLYEEADLFARKAMESATSNPLVLSLVSQTRVMLHENLESGLALAKDAQRLSPNNAFAFAATATGQLRVGDAGAAIEAARKGVQLAQRSNFVHWWESLAGMASLIGGNYASAISYYEAARARAPNFRSPLRHLLFLYLKCGQPEKALRIYQDLKRVEPDFSFELIRDDPTYPAGTLRRLQLLKMSLPQ